MAGVVRRHGTREGWSLDTSGYLPPRQDAYYSDTKSRSLQKCEVRFRFSVACLIQYGEIYYLYYRWLNP
jgi:hypothetical protein